MTSKVWKAHFYHKYAYSISTYTILYYTKPTPCHPERLLIYWLTFGFKCPPCIETRYKSAPFIWNLSLAWSCHCSHRHQNAKPLLTFQHYNWGLLPHCVWGGNSQLFCAIYNHLIMLSLWWCVLMWMHVLSLQFDMMRVWMKIKTQTPKWILGGFSIVELSTLSFHLRTTCLWGVPILVQNASMQF